jgi:hypothetical protein
MQRENLCYAAAAAICAAWLFLPSSTQARGPAPHLSVSGDGDKCLDLKVRSEGEVARAEESFTLPKTQPLAIDATTRGGIRVRGWDRSEYSVQACKIAVAETRAGAESDLKGISVKQASGRFSASGPATGEWMVYYIVHAPKDADLDLETRNGPLALDGVAGRIKVRAANGPVSIRECSGEIQARAANGPVSFSGAGGDVSLAAQNGPLSIRLSGSEWQGPKFEARTVNGPLSLHLPDAYRSGIRIETSGHAPLSCRAGICAGAHSEVSGDQRSLELNGANPVVRLSTGNGPVAVRSDGHGPLMI